MKEYDVIWIGTGQATETIIPQCPSCPHGQERSRFRSAYKEY